MVEQYGCMNFEAEFREEVDLLLLRFQENLLSPPYLLSPAHLKILVGLQVCLMAVPAGNPAVIIEKSRQKREEEDFSAEKGISQRSSEKRVDWYLGPENEMVMLSTPRDRAYWKGQQHLRKGQAQLDPTQKREKQGLD